MYGGKVFLDRLYLVLCKRNLNSVDKRDGLDTYQNDSFCMYYAFAKSTNRNLYINLTVTFLLVAGNNTLIRDCNGLYDRWQ